MTFDTMSRFDDVEFLISAARKAAKVAIMPKFRSLGTGEVSAKSREDDLVTVADREAEAMISADVRTRWPDALVVGEEAVCEGKVARRNIANAHRTVLIDPIDGTWNFAHGLAVFGVMIALVERGETVAGILYDPVGDDTVVGIGGIGAFHVGRDGSTQRLKTASVHETGRMMGYSGHGLLPKQVQGALAVPLTRFHRVLSLRCSCHEYRMVAMGHVSFIITGTLEPWDHAAGALIVVEAGGYVAQTDGSPYRPYHDRGSLIAASSNTAWDAVSEVVGPAFRAFNPIEKSLR